MVVASLDGLDDISDLCLELTLPRAEIYNDIIYL